MDSIYRFTSFESLVDMVQTKELTFLSPALWDDPYENYVFSAMKTVEGRSIIEIILKEYLTNNFGPNWAVLSSFQFAIFGQCWTKLPESDALWRIYSQHNMAVRIEMDREDVNNLDGVTAHDVTYLQTMNLADEIKEMFSQDGKNIYLHVALCKKREAFSHEQEVRLLTPIDLENVERATACKNSSKIMESALKTLREKGEIDEKQYATGMGNVYKKKELPRTSKRISFKDIPNFIKSVLLHPMAPEWFDKTLFDYCTAYKIPYEGKSSLYRLKIQ